MVAFKFGEPPVTFGGMFPKEGPRVLPPGQAQIAVNCDLISGPLEGLPDLTEVIDLSAYAPVKKAYRIPGKPGSSDTWLALPDIYASVCPSPIANDAYGRVWWTLSGQSTATPSFFWTTPARITASQPPYTGGTYAPGTAPTVATTGGTATPVSRAYLVTYIDSFGQESLPSPASAVVSGPSDATWNVTLPSPPSPPGGYTLPSLVTVRIYRTVASYSQGATFYQVVDLPYSTTAYADTTADSVVVNNLAFEGVNWTNPPNGLDGIVAHPGGFFIGFTGNTLHFSEVDRPNVWPAAYDISLLYPIVALAVWNQTVVVLTAGFPYSLTGNSPAVMNSPTMISVPEPCIARGSVAVDLLGVYYASPNGLIMINYFGANNRTLSYFTAEQWQTTYQAANILCARHRTQYLAVIPSGGFLVDYAEQRLGVVDIPAAEGVENCWSDASNGVVYMLVGNVVYRWDDPSAARTTYRWQSKEFFFKAPTNLAALQITQDTYPDPGPPASVQSAMPPGMTTDDIANSLELPAGQSTLLRVYADRNEIWWGFITQPRQMIRSTSGVKSYVWTVEIVSKVPIYSLEMASTAKELTTV